MNIEFTTTACTRPEVIDETYFSFTSNLKGVDFNNTTLYLNIDPIPFKEKAIEVVDVARKYFGNVVYNITENGNLTSAIKWTWGKLEREFNFYLQDDWILLSDVSIDTLVSKIQSQNDANCVSVTLRAYEKKSNRIVLAPSLFLSSFCKKISTDINEKYSTERQLWYSSGDKCVLEKGLYSLRHPDNGLIIKDIGRDWLSNKGYKKEKKGLHFKTWEKK